MPILPAGAWLLVEFRAGRLIRDGSTVTPDQRKGLLRVIRVRLDRCSITLAASSGPLAARSAICNPPPPHAAAAVHACAQTEDGLVHVEWFERKDNDATEAAEYDEIVFPDEAAFEAVRVVGRRRRLQQRSQRCSSCCSAARMQQQLLLLLTCICRCLLLLACAARQGASARVHAQVQGTG